MYILAKYFPVFYGIFVCYYVLTRCSSPSLVFFFSYKFYTYMPLCICVVMR